MPSLLLLENDDNSETKFFVEVLFLKSWDDDVEEQIFFIEPAGVLSGYKWTYFPPLFLLFS